MSLVIALVITIGLATVLFMVMGKKSPAKKKNGSGSNKNKAQIIKEANKILAKDPHNPDGLEPLGGVYFISSIWDKALPIYDTLTKLGIKDGRINLYNAYYRAGICCIRLERYPEAINYLVGATKLNGTTYEANFSLGYAFFKSTAYDKAIPLFKKALIINPAQTELNRYLGQSFYNSNKFRDSLPYLRKALDEDPSDKETLFCMANAMVQEGHGEKSIKVFMHLRADPVYGARSCLQAGLYHAKLNQIDEAIQDFEIGLKHENTPQDIKIDIQYNLARCYFEKNQIPKGLMLLKTIRTVNSNYKDVNNLIGRYQELSQNKNLQLYITSNNSEFVTLCRKFITTRYKNSTVKIQNIDVDVLYTDILTEIYSAKWEDVALFRFFRTTGATGEIYVREFHSHMQDVKAARGFCISAGVFSQEAHKYIEGRPIDLIEKNDLTKVLKQIAL